jgi:hypothetical protein
MKIHYKGRPWQRVIDPAFNIIIKNFLEIMGLVNIPSNKGHLILNLPEDSLKKIEREGYPKFSKFYEKEDIKDVFEESKLLFADELKDMGYQVGSNLPIERAQRRVAHSNGWKSCHGRSRSHVAWMAGGDGNVAF